MKTFSKKEALQLNLIDNHFNGTKEKLKMIERSIETIDRYLQNEDNQSPLYTEDIIITETYIYNQFIVVDKHQRRIHDLKEDEQASNRLK